MGEPRQPEKTSAGDTELRVQLTGLSMLMFAVDPDHPEYERAQRLDGYLKPVREEARRAMRLCPRVGRVPPYTRTGLRKAWQLLDAAAPVIDSADWWLREEMTLRSWAEEFIDTVREAAKKHPPGSTAPRRARR